MVVDNEVKVTGLKLKLTINGDKVITKSVKLKVITKEHEYFAIAAPVLTFRTQKSKNKVNDLKIYDVRIGLNTTRVRHTVSSNFRTNRVLRDIDYRKHLSFNGVDSFGKLGNVLAGKKAFTIVLKVATTDNSKRGSTVYDFPWFFGTDEYGNSYGELGIGYDNGNAYVWGNMGDGGELE